MRYAVFTYIDSDAPIALFFNKIMQKLSAMRVMCVPDSFHKDKNISSFLDGKFCDFCRYETWMHDLVDRLEEWHATISEFFNEFNGNWKYYAASHRITYIREYGGDENDMDKEGNVRKEGLKDNDYLHYTVLSDLYDDGWRDIVQDTQISDMRLLCADLVTISRIDVLGELCAQTGCDIEAYKQGKDGRLRKIPREERELDMIEDQVEADDDCLILKTIAGGVQCVLRMFKTCKYNKNNTELLKIAEKAIAALLDMDFKALDKVTEMYEKKFI